MTLTHHSIIILPEATIENIYILKTLVGSENYKKSLAIPSK